jgi:phage tail sheath protein FI
MIETLHPGLYAYEITSQTPAQSSVGVKVGAFVGIAPKGDVGVATTVKNWTEFLNTFGSYITDSYLAYAVKGFFDNGGAIAKIVRTVHYNAGLPTSAKATTTLKDSTPANSVTINAINDGAWGNDISVQVSSGSQTHYFNLSVYYKNALVESYTDLTISTIDEIESNYITPVVVGTVEPATNESPVALTTGADGITGMVDADYVGDSALKTGLYAFDGKAINYLAIPGITSSTVENAILDYVDNRGDCFAVLEVPMGSTPATAKTFVTTTAKLSSENGDIYYPWLVVSDPIGVGSNPKKVIPPSGHIMGVIANMNTTKGAYVAPAGVDAVINGVLGLETIVDDFAQDILNPVNINALRVFDDIGVVIWGARTLSTGDFMYVNNKLTQLDLIAKCMDDLKWTTFRGNDDTLWGAIKSNVENKCNALWSKGGLKGKTAKEAYYVKCDAEINTDDVIDAGKTYCDIGLAYKKPNEFTVFRIAVIH